MINQESLTAIYPLVDFLNAQNAAVRPMENTVLSACNQAGITPIIDSFHGDVGFEEAWLESLTRTPVVGALQPTAIDGDGDGVMHIPTTVHGATMDDCVEVIAGSAIRALDHTRNVARPFVSAMIDGINEHIDDMNTITEPYEIVDVNLHEAWDHPIVLSALKNFEPYNIPRQLKRADIPRLSLPETMMGGISFGSAQMDEVFQQLMTDSGLTMADLFDGIFRGHEHAGAWPENYWRRNETLLRFMLCNYLVDNPIPQSGMDGMQWRTVMNNLSVAYGSLAYHLLEYAKRDLEHNYLLLSFDGVNGKIYLDGRVYDKFLANGGKPEVIYGAVMRDGSGTKLGYDDALSNMAVYEAAWSSFHSAKKMSDDTKYCARMQEILLTVILTEIDNLEVDFYPPGKSVQNLVNDAKVAILKLTNHDLRDLPRTAMNLACDVVFPHTPAKYLLARIADLTKDGMEPKEAAGVAATEYITDWVASGLIIKKL